MADTWDEIWKKPAFKEISVPLPPGRPWVSAKVAIDKEWLKEVKDEGDKLKKKLEAIKVELGRIQTSTSLLGRRYNISAARFHEFVSNLWKAIGEKDPRVQCEGCPDMCVAYTEVHGKCPRDEEEGS